MNFVCRLGTWDDDVFSRVFYKNEYQLPEEFSEDDVIFDIGLHIGSFSFSCLYRGAGTIYGFEPFVESFNLAKHNLRHWDNQIHLYNNAVWSSETTLYWHSSEVVQNTGAGHVSEKVTNNGTRTVILDDILKKVDKVRLMKIDCEGSEFEIIKSSQLLGKCEEIIGEYHTEYGSKAELFANLKKKGFTIIKDIPETTAPLGLFFARHD